MISLFLAAFLVAQSPTPNVDQPYLLEFSSDKCPPCRTMKPIIASMERAGYPIKVVDIEKNSIHAEKYGVTLVPTILLVDRNDKELGRKVGVVSAKELGSWWRSSAKTGEFEQAEPAAQTPTNPSPWSTVVRISVKARQSTGFGSGTVVQSTPEASLVLTCAHLFADQKLTGCRGPEFHAADQRRDCLTEHLPTPSRSAKSLAR